MITTFLSWEIHSVDYAVTSAGGVREGWYLPGSSFESSITIRNSNIFPLMFYLKEGTENVEIVDKVDERFLLNPGESREVTLQINSPEDTSLYREKIIVNSYIPLLPEQVISEVYQYNPVYPLFLMIGEIVVLLFVLQKVSGTGNVVAVRVRIKRTGLWRFKL
jgi:signal peptidase